VRLVEDEKHDEKQDDHDHDHDVKDGAHTDHDHDHEGGGHEHDHAHSVAKDPKDYTLEDGQSVFLDPAHLFHHVQDSYEYELPKFMGLKKNEETGELTSSMPVPPLTLLPKGYGKMSKFMFNELIVALICAGLFIWLASKGTSLRPSWSSFATRLLSQPSASMTTSDSFPFFLHFSSSFLASTCWA